MNCNNTNLFVFVDSRHIAGSCSPHFAIDKDATFGTQRGNCHRICANNHRVTNERFLVSREKGDRNEHGNCDYGNGETEKLQAFT